MSVRPSRLTLAARALVVAALAIAGLGTAPAAQAGTVGDLLCAVTSLPRSLPLATALESGISAGLVRTENALSADQLDRLAGDDSTWLDMCGKIFVVDEAAPERQMVVADSAPANVPSDVFDLSSQPGSTRTVYLDFDGATTSGTRWKNGQEIVSPAYSIDSDPSTFSETERAQIYLAWQVVSEDFARFDVNVTTRKPAPSALTRTSSVDQTYGMPVVITPTNSVATGCSCGGVAYVGVFGNPGANDAQPAWIFTRGSGTGGYNMGQVISHEVGHTFGLSHDGTSQSAYYAGAKGWAPIMGSSYSQRASHWSSGEYAGANNTEDDVAIIARTAPVLADDHAGTQLSATKVSVGSTTPGTITSRTDTDAFTFTAGGPITLTVAGPAGYSNLDVEASLLDALGTRIATIDPVADVSSDESMAATWSAELPSAAASYTVVVDGVGFGDPKEAGRYSDYGSLGAYTVTVADGPPPTTTPTQKPTQPPTQTPTQTSTETPAQTPAPTPTGNPAASTTTMSTTTVRQQIAFVTTRLPRARVGKKYRAVITFSGPVSEARVDWRLPRGLKWRVRGNRIVISGKVRKRTTSRFTTVLSGDDDSVRHRFRLVVR